MKQPLISVIVPVYNSADFLEECLNSITLQTYTNLEIICINDGSTDNSSVIMKKFQEKDKRFIILEQKNLGASAARNLGIQNATGEFVSFVDSDDRISLSLYQKFVNLKQKPDIFMFNACEYNKETTNVFPNYFFSTNEWKKHIDESTILTFQDNINPFLGNLSAVNKIYKIDFLKQLPELFLQECIFEDQYFFFLTVLNAKSIMVNTDPLYYYRSTNPNSVTKNLSSKVFDIFKIIDKIEKLLKDKNLYEEYKYALFQHKYKQFAILFLKADNDIREKFYIEMKTRLQKYSFEDLNPQITERLVLIGMYKNILKFSASEFFEKYNGKITG